MTAAISKLNNIKLRDQAYAYICNQFAEGKLHVGSQLSIGTLAKEMGISRTPVSEALLRMQLENKVEQVPRGGTIVRKPSAREIAELYQLRELVEGHAAAHAAQTFTPEDFALLDTILDQIKNVCIAMRNANQTELDAEEIRKYLAADLAFHAAILRGTDNRWMRKAIEDAQAFLLICCSRRHEKHTLKTMIDIYRWHGRIRNAIKRQDPNAARDLMQKHIRISCEGAVKFLAEHEEDSDKLEYDFTSLMPQGFDALGKNQKP
ncbi:GntR family transcriptional regulator [Poriferisphaera sp. WC338]|uniref:GntR family transcriptional regulator n=1 Tax=Poriferisphaera sp. WC338 TaxID=3425129 RepID=UPI003D817EB1